MLKATLSCTLSWHPPIEITYLPSPIPPLTGHVSACSSVDLSRDHLHSHRTIRTTKSGFTNRTSPSLGITNPSAEMRKERRKQGVAKPGSHNRDQAKRRYMRMVTINNIGFYREQKQFSEFWKGLNVSASVL
jgi:hypothetical protein